MMRYRILAICVAMLLLGSACKKQETPAETAEPSAKPTLVPAPLPESPIAVLVMTDLAGNQAEIASQPKKVISLSPAVTEIFYALGCSDVLIGVDEQSDYPTEAQALKRYHANELDAIIAAKPEAIFTDAAFPQASAQALRDAGITVAVGEASSFSDIYMSIALISQVMDADASALVGEMRSVLLDVETKEYDFEPVSALLVLQHNQDGTFQVAGAGSLFNELITMVYSTSATAEGTPDIINASELAQLNPQVVLLASDLDMDRIQDADGYKELEAVQAGRIYSIDVTLVTRPGPRAANGLLELYEALEQAANG